MGNSLTIFIGHGLARAFVMECRVLRTTAYLCGCRRRRATFSIRRAVMRVPESGEKFYSLPVINLPIIHKRPAIQNFSVEVVHPRYQVRTQNWPSHSVMILSNMRRHSRRPSRLLRGMQPRISMFSFLTRTSFSEARSTSPPRSSRAQAQRDVSGPVRTPRRALTWWMALALGVCAHSHGDHHTGLT